MAALGPPNVRRYRPPDKAPRPARPRKRPPEPAEQEPEPTPTPRERFLATDPYRADREWQRYEGTPQRDLFRQLRIRFLRRHAVDGGWAIDVGSGPGRFTPFLGGPSSRRVALDLSRAMLDEIPRRLDTHSPETVGSIDRVRADSVQPPFPPRTFREVAVLGNTLGFAGEKSPGILTACEALVAPGGTLILEIAPGPGEISRYLGRLPPRAVGRLLEAPPKAVIPRIDREGFLTERPRHEGRSFRRWGALEVIRRWKPLGWEAVEVLSVAPVLGPDNACAEAVAREPRAWNHLLEIEEFVGRREERWTTAAAVLLAAQRAPLKGHA
ncbi:MAG: class I SAM-dependent methyltransferase [Thermoplasmata archaeon]